MGEDGDSPWRKTEAERGAGLAVVTSSEGGRGWAWKCGFAETTWRTAVTLHSRHPSDARGQRWKTVFSAAKCGRRRSRGPTNGKGFAGDNVDKLKGFHSEGLSYGGRTGSRRSVGSPEEWRGRRCGTGTVGLWGADETRGSGRSESSDDAGC
ncbi:extensin [Iris pallida]|uniref:Extensin n=1 Tax=Iris pallida TaxID=29817 RepID=A0AAX6H9I4_IRIPA|nr:extensin [Iris pallida]